MIDTKAMLERIKSEISDEGVFSEDQINTLKQFADDLDDYITARIENFATMNL